MRALGNFLFSSNSIFLDFFWVRQIRRKIIVGSIFQNIQIYA